MQNHYTEQKWKQVSREETAPGHPAITLAAPCPPGRPRKLIRALRVVQDLGFYWVKKAEQKGVKK